LGKKGGKYVVPLPALVKDKKKGTREIVANEKNKYIKRKGESKSVLLYYGFHCRRGDTFIRQDPGSPTPMTKRKRTKAQSQDTLPKLKSVSIIRRRNGTERGDGFHKFKEKKAPPAKERLGDERLTLLRTKKKRERERNDEAFGKKK